MGKSKTALMFCALMMARPGIAGSPPLTKPEAVGLSAQRLDRIDDAVSRDLADSSKAGAVIAVARHGKLAYLKAFGFANRELQIPMRTDNLFRLYSETKPLVSVGLLMLYEEGHFSLKDPVEMHIPSFARLRVFDRMDGDQMVTRAPARKPTMQDLFRHTMGFAGGSLWRYGGPVEKLVEKAPPFRTLATLIERLADEPLAYEPGTEWRYGPEHDVQAYLIEKFSGVPVDEFLRLRLFEPLRMKDTFYKVPEAAVSRYTVMYEFGEKGDIKVWDPAFGSAYAKEAAAAPRGGSGISSTAQDQLRFGQMLLNGGSLDGAQILSRKTVELMLTDQLPEEVKEVSLGPGSGLFPGYRYGLGISLVGDLGQSAMLGSEGAANWAGFANTDLYIDPKEDMLIIAWTQSRPGDFRWMEKIRSLAYQALVDQRNAKTGE